MINLLPILVRKQLANEHRVRVATVSLFMLAFLVCTYAAMALPSFFALFDAHREEIARVGATTSAETLAQAERVQAANSNAKLLLSITAEQRLLPSAAFALVERARTQVAKGVAGIVRLERFDYKNGEQALQVELAGVARDRDALRQLIAVLESMPEVATADAPVASFLPSTQLPFTLTITFQ